MAVFGRTGVFPHRIDKTTDANARVDYEHKEVHSGDAFYKTIVFTSTEGTGPSLDILIQTPNTTEWSHFFFVFESTAKVLIELYEAVTGTIVASTVRERNRNYADASATLQIDTAAFANGTLIWNWGSGYSTTTRGQSPQLLRNSGELVLKQNTKYGLRITTYADGTTVSSYMTWYEHVNIE